MPERKVMFRHYISIYVVWLVSRRLFKWLSYLCTITLSKIIVAKFLSFFRFLFKPKLSDFWLDLRRSLAHQRLAKILDISTGMPPIFANLAASRSRHISSPKIAQLRLNSAWTKTPDSERSLRGVRNERQSNPLLFKRLLCRYAPRNNRKNVIQEVFVQAIDKKILFIKFCLFKKQ